MEPEATEKNKTTAGTDYRAVKVELQSLRQQVSSIRRDVEAIRQLLVNDIKRLGEQATETVGERPRLLAHIAELRAELEKRRGILNSTAPQREETTAPEAAAPTAQEGIPVMKPRRQHEIRMPRFGVGPLFKLAGFLANTLVAVALSTVIFLFLVPRFLNWDLQVVLSGSMEPALPVGSLIFVQPVKPVDVGVGDIITYRNEGGPSFITHRVVEVNGQGAALSFRTKGDANESADESPVAAPALKGRVWGVIPFVGYLAQYVRKPLGFLLLVGIPGVLIIAGELRTIVRELKSMRSRRRIAQEVEL